jgi:hypothetical protein
VSSIQPNAQKFLVKKKNDREIFIKGKGDVLNITSGSAKKIIFSFFLGLSHAVMRQSSSCTHLFIYSLAQFEKRRLGDVTSPEETT